jgi:branched-subunit amino acid aminotransferase/4-amino-4-deoxychorismate lyase
MAEALFETVRVIDGRVPLWPLHRWRLLNSALTLGLPMPEVAAPSGGADRIVRLEFTAEAVVITEREVTEPEPIALASSPAPHRGYRHKTTARAWLEAARATARAAAAHDALLFDAEGRLIEATRWSIGWWDGETLCFPPFALGGLKSVSRARLQEVTRNGLRDEVLTGAELAKRSLVACNAARGLIAVGMLDGTPVRGNPRTEALARRFWDRPDA